MLQIRVLSDQVAEAQKRLDQLARTGGDAERAVGKMERGVNGAMSKLRDLAVVAGGVKRTLETLWRVAQVPIEITRQFQLLRAQLTTATGSVENMTEAWEALADFATETPFTLQNSVEAFTKLVNYGLEPSERAMRSYGDTAAATGKTFTQMVEAVADAVNNDFERAKEAFNVKAKNMGDTISFRFRGVTTEVENSAKAIEEYFISLGENNFSGGMARQMNTLTGKLANLEDAWDMFWYEFTTSSGAADLYGNILIATTEFIQEMNAMVTSGQLDALWESQRHQLSLFLDDLDGAKGELNGFFEEMGEWLNISEGDWQTISQNIPLFFRTGVKAVGIELATIALVVNELNMGIKDQFTEAADHLEDVFTKAVEAVKALLGQLRQIWDGIVTNVQPYVDSAMSAVGSTLDAGRAWVQPYVNQIVDSATSATDAIVSQTSDAVYNSVESIVDKASNTLPVKVAGAVSDSLGSQIDAGLFPDFVGPAQGTYDKIQNILQERDQLQQDLIEETVQGVQKTEELIAKAEELRSVHDQEIFNNLDDKNGKDRLKRFGIGGDGGTNTPTGGTGGGSGGGVGDYDKLVQGLQREEDAIRDSYDRRLQMIQENTQAGTVGQMELSLQLIDQYEKEALAAHEAKRDQYDNLFEWLSAERDLVKQMYEERRQIIVSATELTEQQKMDALAKAQKQYVRAMQTSLSQSSEEYLSSASSLFRDLASMGDAFGKTGFKVAQGAAIAEATIAMYTSAVNAYKTGSAISPVLGPVFAAAALAAGAANIARIKSQTYQGSGGSVGLYEHGGMIPAGQVGVVGEAGPEFVRGPMAVTSARTTADAHKGRNGGKEVVINIQNYGGGQVETRTTETDDRKIIDVIVGQVKREVANDIRKGGGDVSRAIEATYAQTRGRRRGA